MGSHNDRDPMLPHGSDKCQCPTCGLYFNSGSAFDRHRKGPWDARYCLTEDQMTAAGWFRNRTGHWATAHRGMGRGVAQVIARAAREKAK